MNFIEQTLLQLENEDNLRKLRISETDGKYIIIDGEKYLNFSSNDYLGLSNDLTLQKVFLLRALDQEKFLMSNSSSRLMTGNSEDYYELEDLVSGLYGGSPCLIFSSGYAANTGILPALTSSDDMIVADKLVHASIIDGLRLCSCEWTRYQHNNLDHLENIISKIRKNNPQRRIWVVTESLFSMDGDLAPLEELINLKNKYGFMLILDEAHAFGVYGKNGAGLAQEKGLAENIDIIVGTFGKALASFGGFAVMDKITRELVINKMRPFIFTTAIPPLNLQWTRFMVDSLPDFEKHRSLLRSLVRTVDLRSGSNTHIIPVMAYDNTSAEKMAMKLREEGIWATPIRYPTVPNGKARIRLSITASMDKEDILIINKLCRDII